MTFDSLARSRYFYHFTHVSNLASIIEFGLLSTNQKNLLALPHRNIAAGGIQERRSEMQVTCAPKGTIHDYVPFYMCVRNPMLLSVLNKKNIDQQEMIFFALRFDKISSQKMVFTDASANTVVPPSFYNDVDDLDKLDWELIDSQRWGTKTKDEMHRRMAEVLIRDKVTIDMVDTIIVWNKSYKKEVLEIFEKSGCEAPDVHYSPLGTTLKFNFFYTKFSIGRPDESLITGPSWLREYFNSAVKTIKKNRSEAETGKKYLFVDIQDALKKIAKDFTIIPEMAEIYKLATDNTMHKENVSDHTLSVLDNLTASRYYKSMDDTDRGVLAISAYLHDIGKGPKSMWKNEIQQNYPDHPADAPKMLERILVEDFEYLSNYEIRKICLLVTYHDLIGEIIGRGRDKQQLFDLIRDEKELQMLSALNYADVAAINEDWAFDYQIKVRTLKAEALDKIQ